MINKLILGTVQFGLDYGINNTSGKIDQNVINDILSYAYNNGIDTLDTADAYGNASVLIGIFHKNQNEKFNIITKFKSGYSEIEEIEKSLKNTLKKLHVSSVYGYLYHSYDDFVRHKNVLQQLLELKDKGLINHIGVSIYTNEQFREVLKSDEIEIIQLPYNLLDNYQQRGALMKLAKEQGKIIHIRSIFLQGLFFKSIDTLPNFLLPLKTDLEKIHSVAASYQIDMATLALCYALENKSVDGILIGVDSLKQLQMNIKTANSTLPKKVMNEIDLIDVKNISLLNPSNWK